MSDLTTRMGCAFCGTSGADVCVRLRPVDGGPDRLTEAHATCATDASAPVVFAFVDQREAVS
ncbi:hypothetical protein ACRAR1_19885 [Streptomyces sanyensis]|uniref:hypothetical protein n=1 Tax=Streptomyces sanyensis TaxID=568869 RepID=UPI003D7781CE